MRIKTKLLAFGILLATRAWLVPTVLAQSTYEPYTFTTLAGNAGYGHVDGAGSDARFYRPTAMAIDNAGNVYVADLFNNKIRKLTSAGVVTTLPGEFYYPRGVAVDSAGNVYVAFVGLFWGPFSKVTPAGVVAELVGLVDETGSDAQFASRLSGLEIDFGGRNPIAALLRLRKIIFVPRLTTPIRALKRFRTVFLPARPRLLIFTPLEPGS